MESELAVLIEILEEQRDHQAALVGLSDKKTRAIAGGDAEQLHGIVEEEKAVLARIKAVEQRQDNCVRKLAEILKLPHTEIRMSLILEKAGDAQKETLTRLRDELSGLIGKQQKCNDINMKLLQMNLDYVQFLVNSGSSQKSGGTYGSGGSVKQAAAFDLKRLLDRKV